MAIERWKPTRTLSPWRMFHEMEEAGRRFDSIFDDAFLPAIWRRFPTMERDWTPAIEVLEKEDRYIVKAELPGIKKEDVEVSLHEDILTLKGEKKVETEGTEDDYRWTERSYGSFYRTVMVPAKVDSEKIEARYEDGVLEIDLPKVPEIKPKKITVTTKGEKKGKSEK